MDSFVGILKAFSWLILCVIVACILLATALIYNGFSIFRKGFVIRKLELPKIQISR